MQARSSLLQIKRGVPFFLLSVLFFYPFSLHASLPSFRAPKQVCFSSHCFYVDVADTPETRQKGLMNVSSLPINTGMLFYFEEPDYYRFWMKNTLIYLDILWIDKNRKIVDITTNAVPLEHTIYSPSTPCTYVLEINGGLSEKLGLSPGQLAFFKY